MSPEPAMNAAPLNLPSPRLISILQSDDVWIVANFHREDLEQLHAGQRASIRAAQWVFPARVEFVSGTDGWALLEFVRPAVNPAAVLRPGAPAEVVVEVGSPLALYILGPSS